MSGEFKDYYKILGVSKDAGQDDIKRSFRQLARKYHPDMHQDNKTENAEKFKEINEAYEVLSDREKRAKYDSFGADFENKAAYQKQYEEAMRRQRQTKGPQHSYSHEDFSFNEGDFSDFFRAFFGGGAGGFSQHGFGGGQPETGAPSDIRADLTLSLKDAYTGGKKIITMSDATACAACSGRGAIGRRTCSACGGSGETQQQRQITVNFPRGIKDGASLRLRKQTMAGGDVYLKIKLLDDDNFTLKGGDLFTGLKIMPWQAVSGAVLSVPLLDGCVKIKVPPMTHTGQKLKIKGKGWPSASSSGDLYVEIIIDIPLNINDRQKQLFEQLAS